MNVITIMGIDISKHNFHLHAQDKTDDETLRRKCSRQLIIVFLGASGADTHGGAGVNPK